MADHVQELEDFAKLFGRGKPATNPRFEAEHPRGRHGEWIDKSIVRRIKAVQITRAFQLARLRPDMVGETVTSGDYFMSELAHDFGFHGSPTKVTEEELAKAVKDGEVRELWRGLTDESYARKFIEDGYFVGGGFRGNGIYTSYGADARRLAVAYAHAPSSRGRIVDATEHPSVLHLGLKRQARIVDYSQIKREAKEESLRLQAIIDGKLDADARQKRDAEIEYRIALDPGRYAMSKGYDAMVVDDNEIAVFNRTALVVATEIQAAKVELPRAA